MPDGLGNTRPYYTRRRPATQRIGAVTFANDPTFIDLHDDRVHLPAFGATVADAVERFDLRAAAAISAATGLATTTAGPSDLTPADLFARGYLERHQEGTASETLIPKAKCVAALAHLDFFPDNRTDDFSAIVSAAITASSPGWCGTFGPGVDGTLDVIDNPSEGNYDMTQMHLLQIAYAYDDRLTPDAREHLITVLLAKGRIRRPNLDDIVTSGAVPNDWSRAGFLEMPVSAVPIVGDLLGHLHPKLMRIGETENHILMMHTARYLTNQLLYQRDHDRAHDNRRNGSDDAPSCTALALALCRNMLRGDFSEYNAKNYQNETRSALLNLCSYEPPRVCRRAVSVS